MNKIVCALLALTHLACSEPDSNPIDNTPETWQGKHAEPLRFGAQDNSEVVKLLPGGDRAILVASKARKVTLLAVGEGLTEVRSVTLFPGDSSESELTHIDFDSQGRFAAVTRTLPITADGAVTDCQGSLVFVDVSDTETFGTVLHEVAVGPMPDAVDISADDRWIVTADEVDFNDGKCPVEAVEASISILELSDADPATATVRAVIAMGPATDAGRREPEQVIIAPDNDRVALPLQDTHELLTFQISKILAGPTPLETPISATRITSLPNRLDGAEPWPDGVHHFVDGAGAGHFVVAGEFNDTLHFFGVDGAFERQIEIRAGDVPPDLPRNLEEWSKAPFRPDSVVGFHNGGKSYVAASLKHAGAVGVWDVTNVAKAQLVNVIKVGFADEGTPTTESSIGTEGISASADGTRIVTANEGESSVSLVTPLRSVVD